MPFQSKTQRSSVKEWKSWKSEGYSLIRFKVGDAAKKPMWCCGAACECEGKGRSEELDGKGVVSERSSENVHSSAR